MIKISKVFLFIILCSSQLLFAQKIQKVTSSDAANWISVYGDLEIYYWPQNPSEGTQLEAMTHHEYDIFDANGSRIKNAYTDSNADWYLGGNYAYQGMLFRSLLANDKVIVVDLKPFLPNDTYQVEHAFMAENNLIVQVRPSANIERNVFIHLNKIQQYFKNTFGRNISVEALMTDEEEVNAQAQNDGASILFGRADDINWGEHSDVIYHEFTHNIIYDIYGYYPYGIAFSNAILEGMADYFACSFNNESLYAENTTSTRQLNNSAVWVDGAGVYTNGVVLGGAFWDLRELVGRTVADNLAYRTMAYSPHPTTEEQFLENLVKADKDYYNSAHQNEIYEAFYVNHGLERSLPTTISSNTTLYGYYVAKNDLTIPSGKTLTIEEGTFLSFENNKKLIVYGNLDVNGTNSNKVTFDFVNKSSNGIYCYSGSSVDIDFAEIINGYYGVYVDHCSPTIKNTTISNTTYSIRANYSNPIINDCNISNSLYGIYLYNTNTVNMDNPSILNNTIEDMSNYGIYLYNSTAHIRGNEISGCSRGVYGYYSSTAYLGEVGYLGNNKIHDNYNGIYSYYNSYMLLGRVACETIGGDNAVYTNTYKNAYVANNSEIQAAHTWWGSAPPPTSKFYVASGCTLIYSQYLMGNPLSKVASNNVSPEETLFNGSIVSTSPEKTSGKTYHYDKKWPLDWKILYLRNLVLVEDFKYAQKICEEIINNYPDSSQAMTALSLYQQASKKDDFSSFINFLNNKVDSKKTSVLNAMIEMCLLDLEDVQVKNINKYESLIAKYENKEIEEIILFHDFMYNLFDLDDYDNARKISDKIDHKFKDSELALETHRLLGDNVEEPIVPQEGLGRETEGKLSDQYELLGNYPNPFNPSTKIKYATPFVSNVSLEIYDITGRVVKSFEVNAQNSGNYEFVWDGTNITGSRVASGIYFYKLKAQSLEGNGKVFEKTAKLLLMK
jgi:parallel beta-helix repeat protein